MRQRLPGRTVDAMHGAGCRAGPRRIHQPGRVGVFQRRQHRRRLAVTLRHAHLRRRAQAQRLGDDAADRIVAPRGIAKPQHQPPRFRHA